uniref:Cytochrome P450 n=1 Tax=Haemonchus placei TaxID=6290 RepID=A0A0N4XA11_HAEPC
LKNLDSKVDRIVNNGMKFGIEKYPILSSENASLMWMQMNPRAKHEQFLSNEFPPDFTFDYMNNLLHRIFILGRTSTGTRFVIY